MASKQQIAKEQQGYNPKPLPSVCMNCAEYRSDKGVSRGTFGDFKWERNIRCGLGGFAVKKTATCNEFKLTEQK